MPGRCLACGAEEPRATLEQDLYRYAVCGLCGTASLETGWDHADYGAGYFTHGASHGYYDYERDKRLHLETAGMRLDALAAVVSSPESIVDVGAALGYTLEVARRRGLEALAVEHSEYAAGRLAELGYTVHPNLGALPPASTGAVLLGQVLEHMPQPDRALREAFDALRPGGGLFVETWDFASPTARRFGTKWQQISPPSVVHLFTAEGLRRLLERTGFTEVEIRPWQKRVSINGALGVMASKMPAPLGKAMMRVAKATRIARIPVTYRFDDLIAVTARKPL